MFLDVPWTSISLVIILSRRSLKCEYFNLEFMIYKWRTTCSNGSPEHLYRDLQLIFRWLRFRVAGRKKNFFLAS